MQPHQPGRRGPKIEHACFVCGKKGHFPELVRAGIARSAVAEHISHTRGVEWQPDSRICQDCLARARQERLVARLSAQRGHLDEVDADLVRRISERESVVESEDHDASPSLGGTVADAVARWGGSWTFVVTFLVLIAVWSTSNALLLRNRGFDPYPFILLNLVLSCVAALQAPVIMMSQNRAERRDRRRGENDYRVNLKAEIEVAALHEKLDHLLHVQYEELVERQETALDLLEQLIAAKHAR